MAAKSAERRAPREGGPWITWLIMRQRMAQSGLAVARGAPRRERVEGSPPPFIAPAHSPRAPHSERSRVTLAARRSGASSGTPIAVAGGDRQRHRVSLNPGPPLPRFPGVLHVREFTFTDTI